VSELSSAENVSKHAAPSQSDTNPDGDGDVSGKVKRKRRRRSPKEEGEAAGEEDANTKRRRSRKKQFDIDAGDKVFTDNFEEVCKCECKYCGQVLTMDEFRVHLRVGHSETIHDYRHKFGEIDFVSLTYHRSVIVRYPPVQESVLHRF
jgi:hypothetical protein